MTFAMWVHPMMLYGALAAGLPVVMHLAMRQRARKVIFSRLLFMEDMPRRSESHFLLRQVLLLLLRIACILLLVLAFARPFRKPAAVASANARAVYVLLNVSGSMNYDGRMKEAIRGVRDRIASLNPDDWAGMAVFDSSCRPCVELAPNPARVSDYLGGVAATHARTNISAALRQGADALVAVKDRERTLVLVSDLQRSGLRKLDQDWRLPEGMQLEVLDVSAKAPANISVSDIVFAQSATGGKPAVRALISAHGGSGRMRLPVRLEMSGAPAQEKEVEVTAGQQRAVEFSLPEDFRAGAGTVAIRPDLLAIDDKRHMVVQAPLKRKVIIALPDAPSAEATEAVFPATALGAGEAARFEVESIAISRLPSVSTAAARLVIVPSDVPLDAKAEAWLKGLLEAGGSVLIALAKPGGDSATRCSLADVELLGWYEADPKATVFHMLADLDLRHAIFAPFRKAGSGNFTAVDFFGHVRVNPGAAASVLASFDDGSPALIERRLSAGRVWLWTSSLGPAWNNLPRRGLFVALMHSIASVAYSEQKSIQTCLVGEAMPLAGPANASATVRMPDGAEAYVQFDAAGQAAWSQTDLPGLYECRSEGAAPILFAVNMDPEESDLESLNADDVKLSMRGDDSPVTAAASIAGASPEQGQDSKSWKALMSVLVVACLLEAFVANRTHR